MMQTNSITKRLRLAALATAAVVAIPLAMGTLPSITDATAAQVAESAPKVLPNGAISYAPIVAANRPAVVTIKVTGKAEPAQFSQRDMEKQFGGNVPFEEFFKRFFDGQEMPFEMPGRPNGPRQGRGHNMSGLGSGFIVGSDGTIVTNNHVIDDAGEITVVMDDGTEYIAELVGADEKTDLAVLKINAGKDLPSLSWGSSEAIQPGDPVLAIGNPFGIGTTATSGIVSARGRDLHSSAYDDFLQVDAPINKGNSGGPLFSVDGKVIGVNTAIYSPNGGNVGVAFAIPSDQAKEIVAKLLEDGSIERGFIGVQIQPVTKEVAEAVGLEKAEGAIVASVSEDTPAGKAGVKTGDIVTKFAGKPVDGPKSLARIVGDHEPGSKQTITVWRKGEEMTLDITVGKPAAEKAAAAETSTDEPAKGDAAVPALGIELSNLDADMRQELGLAEDAAGVVVVKSDGEAGERGIQEGDVIVSINQEPVKTAADAQKMIDAAQKDGKKSVLLLVQRKENQSFVALPFARS
jgi:serine protease Do